MDCSRYILLNCFTRPRPERLCNLGAAEMYWLLLVLWSTSHQDPCGHPSVPHRPSFWWLPSDAEQCPVGSPWTSPWGALMPGLVTLEFGAAIVHWLLGKGLPRVLGLVSVPTLVSADILQPNPTHSWTGKAKLAILLPSSSSLRDLQKYVKQRGSFNIM